MEKQKDFNQTTLVVPPDKSISHRALIFASLAEGVSEIKNVLMSEDVRATIRVLGQLGVKIEIAEKYRDPQGPSGAFHQTCLWAYLAQRTGDIFLQFVFFVHGVGLQGYKPTDKILNCGNSGTTLRLMLGVLAGQGISAKLTGDDSLNRRPMDRVIEPLRKMGAKIEVIYDQGRRVICLAPHSGLRPLNYRLPVASAQVKTALLLAGLTAGVEVTLEEPKATRDHTELLLKQQGIDIAAEKYHPSGSCLASAGGLIRPFGGRYFSFSAPRKLALPRVRGSSEIIASPRHPMGPGIFLRTLHLTIPGDFSSAAFFIVLALLKDVGANPCIRPHYAVPLRIKNVGLNPTRTGLLNVLWRMGAKIEILNKQFCENHRDPWGDLLIKSSPLKNTTVTPDEIPFLIDEIPILALAASFAEGEFVLSGAEELRVKECDRIHAICTELKKLGVDITEKTDGFIIKGHSCENITHRGPGWLAIFPPQHSQVRAATSTWFVGNNSFTEPPLGPRYFHQDLNRVHFSSYGDHRIAMMIVIAGKILGRDLTIDDTGCIETSFPGFLNLVEEYEGEDEVFDK